MKLKIAIIGCRNIHDYALFKEKIFETFKEWRIGIFDVYAIITEGNALVERLTKEYHLQPIILKSDCKRYPRLSGAMCHSDIIAACDRIIAFSSKLSKDTHYSFKKECKVVYV